MLSLTVWRKQGSVCRRTPAGQSRDFPSITPTRRAREAFLAGVLGVTCDYVEYSVVWWRAAWSIAWWDWIAACGRGSREGLRVRRASVPADRRSARRRCVSRGCVPHTDRRASDTTEGATSPRRRHGGGCWPACRPDTTAESVVVEVAMAVHR